MFAFAGPAYMVSVGYMDPGNWATDLAGGAKFGYTLIWVLLMSNLMAVLLQTLSARLGLVTGRDLAQSCRDAYNPFVRWVLFILCEIAIAACDLAEVLGTAIGLNLLTAQMGMNGGHGVPLIWAVVITGADVFLLLAIQKYGIRKMEAVIISLVAMIGVCFIVELFLAKPDVGGIARGFVPNKEIFTNTQMLFIAIGILGATVMPHNLYLHSAMVQSRRVEQTPEGLRQACKYNFIDSAIALNCAFFVNAAILIVSAAVFFKNNMQDVAEIQDAHRLLEGLLGSKIAPIAFAVALICAGQSSTITGTLAGQITMEGFLHFRIRPWLRRLITRSIAIIPAVITIAISGEKGTGDLLVLSQVILSLQLPFAVVPLVKFTSSRKKMGDFATPKLIAAIAWVVAAVIITLNAKLVYDTIADLQQSAGAYQWLVMATIVPASAALLALLAWMTFRREVVAEERRGFEIVAPAGTTMANAVAAAAAVPAYQIQRVGVAVEAAPSDAAMLGHAVALAKQHKAELILIHIVEGVGGQYHGPHAGDAERHADEQYLADVVKRLRRELSQAEVPSIRSVLGFGNIRREIVRLVGANEIDLLVLGGHGHSGIGDVIHGSTFTGVRHGVSIPVLTVRN
jgi:manganese transport protein